MSIAFGLSVVVYFLDRVWTPRYIDRMLEALHTRDELDNKDLSLLLRGLQRRGTRLPICCTPGRKTESTSVVKSLGGAKDVRAGGLMNSGAAEVHSRGTPSRSASLTSETQRCLDVDPGRLALLE